MTRHRVLLLHLKAEACRVLAEISNDAAREAHWLEQARHWEGLATEASREQSRNPALKIALSDAWPVAVQSHSSSAPGQFSRPDQRRSPSS